jgi:cytochrome c
MREYIAGMLPNTEENMLRWLRAPQEVNSRTVRPNLGVSERDVRDMAAYLYTLRDDPRLPG